MLLDVNLTLLSQPVTKPPLQQLACFGLLTMQASNDGRTIEALPTTRERMVVFQSSLTLSLIEVRQNDQR